MSHLRAWTFARVVLLFAPIASTCSASGLGAYLPAGPAEVRDYGPALLGPAAAPGETDGFEADFARLAACGIDTVVLGAGEGVTVETGYHFGCGAGFDHGDADRERIRAALASARASGLRVYLEGFEATRQGVAAPPADQARLVSLALRGALREIEDKSGLAGLMWRLPPPVPAALDAAPAAAEAAAAAWAEGVAEVVRSGAAACGEAGVEFVVVTDQPLLLAAAAPSLPANVRAWREATAPRAPTLVPQIAALEAGVYGPAGGLWLDWETARPADVARAALAAMAADVGAVVLGDASILTEWPTDEMTRTARELSEFSRALSETETDGRPRSDVALVVEPACALARAVKPDPDAGPDQVASTLALLNEAGRSVHIAAAAPPDVLRRDRQSPIGVADRPEGASALFLCNGAAVSDALLDDLFAATDMGYTLILRSDAATRTPGGGARPRESREAVSARLPLDRTRPFGEVVEQLDIEMDLGGEIGRRGAKLGVAPDASHGIWRGEERPGAEVLARWHEAPAPAVAAMHRGSGRVVVVNGAVELARKPFFGEALDYLGVHATRPEPILEETKVQAPPTRTDPNYLDRHGLIVEEPYERPKPAEVVPPPEAGLRQGAAESQSAYDYCVAGSRMTLVSLGPRPVAWGRPAHSMGALSPRLGAWDLVAVADGLAWFSGRGAAVASTRGVSAFDPDTGAYSVVAHRPTSEAFVSPSAGVHRLGEAVPVHCLSDAGGAQVVQALQADDGSLLLEVDRPALLRVDLDPSLFTARRMEVALFGPNGPLPLASPQWWVTWDGKLMVDALGRTPIHVAFPPNAEEGPVAIASIEPGEGATRVTLDGGEAVLLDRYANAVADIVFEHWGEPGTTTTLALTAVLGDLYGTENAGSDAPAAVWISLNGGEVYSAEPPLRRLRLDGSREEWAQLTVALPRERLRRGLNRIAIRNAGPNALAIAAAEVRFEAPAE